MEEVTLTWFMGNVLIWLESLYTFFFVLLIVMVVNILLGIAVAIKEKVFDWRKVVNFLQADALPKIIGWIAISFLSWFAAPEVLGGPLGPLVSDKITMVLWAGIMIAFGGEILSKLAVLGWQLPENIPGIRKDPL